MDFSVTGHRGSELFTSLSVQQEQERTFSHCSQSSPTRRGSNFASGAAAPQKVHQFEVHNARVRFPRWPPTSSHESFGQLRHAPPGAKLIPMGTPRQSNRPKTSSCERKALPAVHGPGDCDHLWSVSAVQDEHDLSLLREGQTRYHGTPWH